MPTAICVAPETWLEQGQDPNAERAQSLRLVYCADYKEAAVLADEFAFQAIVLPDDGLVHGPKDKRAKSASGTCEAGIRFFSHHFPHVFRIVVTNAPDRVRSFLIEAHADDVLVANRRKPITHGEVRAAIERFIPPMVTRSAASLAVQAAIDRLAGRSHLVVLEGRPNAGFWEVTQLAHACSLNSRNPIVVIRLDAPSAAERLGQLRHNLAGQPCCPSCSGPPSLFLSDLTDVTAWPADEQIALSELMAGRRAEPCKGYASSSWYMTTTIPYGELSDNEGLHPHLVSSVMQAEWVSLPSLSERIEDLPELVSHWVAEANRDYSRAVMGLHPIALEVLKARILSDHVDVSEVGALIRQAVAHCEGELIDWRSLDVKIRPTYGAYLLSQGQLLTLAQSEIELIDLIHTHLPSVILFHLPSEAADGEVSLGSSLYMDGEHVPITDHRLAALLKRLIMAGGLSVNLQNCWRELGLGPQSQPKKLVYALRRLMEGECDGTRKSRFVLSHYYGRYSFNPEETALLIEPLTGGSSASAEPDAILRVTRDGLPKIALALRR